MLYSGRWSSAPVDARVRSLSSSRNHAPRSKLVLGDHEWVDCFRLEGVVTQRRALDGAEQAEPVEVTRLALDGRQPDIAARPALAQCRHAEVAPLVPPPEIKTVGAL